MFTNTRARRALVASGEGERCDLLHTDPARVEHLRQMLLSSDDAATVAETFRMLGDTTRVRILDALSKQELCVCELAALVGLTESAVSHQLRLLRSLRIVRARRAGRMVFYSLDDQHIITLFRQALRHVQEVAEPALSGHPSGAHRLG